VTDVFDTHCHLWTLSRGDYSWLTPEYPALYRDFLPSDLLPIVGPLGVTGVVVVQAAATEAETTYLLGLASSHALIRGVVGWTDLYCQAAADRIEALVAAHGALLKGFRLVLDDLPPTSGCQSRLELSLRTMARHNLVLDILSSFQRFHDVRRLLDAAPGLRIVLNHAGSPTGGVNMLSRWRDALICMADAPYIYCKVSGLTNPELLLRDYEIDAVMKHSLEVFGAERLLWASDWPVLCLASDYSTWLERCRSFFGFLSGEAQQRIFYGNAAQLYG